MYFVLRLTRPDGGQTRNIEQGAVNIAAKDVPVCAIGTTAAMLKWQDVAPLASS